MAALAPSETDPAALSQPAKLEQATSANPEFASEPRIAVLASSQPSQALPEFTPPADSMSPSHRGTWPESTPLRDSQLELLDAPVRILARFFWIKGFVNCRVLAWLLNEPKQPGMFRYVCVAEEGSRTSYHVLTCDETSPMSP